MSEVSTKVHVSNGIITVQTMQDVENIIERNKKLQNVPQKSDWGKHVASVPNNIINTWLDEEYAKGNVSLRWGTDEFYKLVWQKINDHDWLYLRTDL